MFKIQNQKISIAWRLIVKVFLVVIFINLLAVLLTGTYLLGYTRGVAVGQQEAESIYKNLLPLWLENLLSSEDLSPTPTFAPSPTPAPDQQTGLIKKVSWGGPELWVAVNKRRGELGVNPLSSRDELCTIASIRLNELLELAKLDGHEGFSNLAERRSDLAWIFEKYDNVAEFLLAGAESSQEAVSLWEDTLGHKKLLTGGEYVWGCIYAQNSFAVAIAAY